MKPTEEQIESIIQLIRNSNVGWRQSAHNAIAHWESIRPPCGECERLKADIIELNQRLHERTQASLGKAARAGR